MADVLDHLRDYGVSEGFKSGDAICNAGQNAGDARLPTAGPCVGYTSVQPGGKPMSASTQAGLSWPLSSSGVTICRSFAREPEPPHLHIAAPPVDVIAVGVGHILTAQFRASVFRRICDAEPLFFESFTVGVGHISLTACSSVGRYPGLLYPPILFARGVGHDPDPVPLVRGANGGSWYAIPADIIPDRGQVSENSAKPSPWPLRWASKQCCDVLHNDDAGSNLANKTGDFGPEAGSCVIGDSGLFSCCGNILAWLREPASDNVNCVTSDSMQNLLF
jgi:hypothetical protein